MFIERRAAGRTSLGGAAAKQDKDFTRCMIASKLVESRGSQNAACESVDYIGSTDAKSAIERHRKLYVAFVNRNTHRISVVPAQSAFMKPYLEKDSVENEEEEQTKMPETIAEKKESVQKLAFTFGSHKKIQALKSSNERRSLAADAVNTAIESAMKAARTDSPSKMEPEKSDEVTVMESGDEFEIGLPNMGASTPADVFKLEKIIPNDLLSQLTPVDTADQKAFAKLPVLVRRCIQGKSKHDERLLRMLTLLQSMLEMFKAKGMKIKKGDCVSKQLPPAVRNFMMQRFMVAIESSGESTTWSLPPRLKTRLLVHILLLAMHSYSISDGNFTVGVQDLQTDIAAAPRTLISCARQFGCTINAGAGSQIISITVPYKPPPPLTLSKRKGGR